MNKNVFKSNTVKSFQRTSSLRIFVMRKRLKSRKRQKLIILTEGYLRSRNAFKLSNKNGKKCLENIEKNGELKEKSLNEKSFEKLKLSFIDLII